MDINGALGLVVTGPGFYETLIYLVYRDWVAKPNSTAIDIGAHTGLHTFRLADCLGPNGRVFAFEPLPELAAGLAAASAARYPGKQRVFVKDVALSDEEGETTFFRNPGAISQSTLVKGHAPNKGATEGFSVKVSSLDRVFGNDRPKYVSVMKIDAEAAEYKILNGAREFLKDAHPLIIMEFTEIQLELIGKTPEDFFKLCDDLDYVFFNVDGTEYDREFVSSGQTSPCYERFGAKRGHWIEGFMRTKFRPIVERAIAHYAKERGIDLHAVA